MHWSDYGEQKVDQAVDGEKIINCWRNSRKRQTLEIPVENAYCSMIVVVAQRATVVTEDESV